MCVFGYLHCQVTYFTICYSYAPSVEITQGVFLSPRNIPTKNFSENFFKSTQGDFLLIFWREFVMRGKAACSLPMGGVPLFCGLVGLWACRWLCFASFLFPLLLRLCRRLRIFPLLRFLLSLWASVPYWLTASGRLWTIGSTLSRAKGAKIG